MVFGDFGVGIILEEMALVLMESVRMESVRYKNIWDAWVINAKRRNTKPG